MDHGPGQFRTGHGEYRSLAMVSFRPRPARIGLKLNTPSALNSQTRALLGADSRIYGHPRKATSPRRIQGLVITTTCSLCLVNADHEIVSSISE